MNIQDLLKFLTGYSADAEKFDLKSILDKTNFDELISIDLQTGRYRLIYHTSNKYYSNLYEGDFERLKSLAKDSAVHPEDIERYMEDFDLSIMKERLKMSEPAGMFKGRYRIKGVDGAYVDTDQLIILGSLLGKDDSIVFVYVYDNLSRIERFHLQEEERGEATGLYEGIGFFKEVRKKIKNLDKNWCIIDILLRKYSLFSDWYGVDRGKDLLTKEAEILKKYVSKNGGLVGFMGQNEFCLVTLFEKKKIDELYKEVKDVVGSISSIESFLPAFGIAMYDGTCGDIREYYNRAALLCELSENSPGESIRMYDLSIHEKNSSEYQLIYDFEKGLDAGYVDFFIQPQIKLPEEKIVGGEALARWYHYGEIISPFVFVPILEKYNLITKLDKYIWEKVCIFIRKLIDEGITPVPLSVNVSRIDILTIDVLTYFNDLLRKYDLTPHYLHIEITESAYAENSAYIGETVKRLRENGYIVLMDDFGSGYSSLNMLKSMTVDVIKLDAQFLRIDTADEVKGINIIESVVNMTRSLGTPIIVEGVETSEQAEYLSSLGCQYMQGYNFYKPIVADDFKKLITDKKAIDLEGFAFKANQQLHTREFLDENIYSDAMLNNIIGPVAFYLWKDDNIDIVRYNEQFFELVGIDRKDFSVRINGIQNYIHPHDIDGLFNMLKQAKEHHVIGSKGVVRSFRPNGEIVVISLKIYFFEEREDGSLFYVSAHDISQLNFDSNAFPGGYYRCSCNDDFEFLYISPNFEKLTGYTSKEIYEIFDNKLINMVHPNDRERLLKECHDIKIGSESEVSPYRLIHKSGEYIYVAEQNKISDMYGVPCYQAVAIDISDSMRLRNQMKILSDNLSDTVLMLKRVNGALVYETVIYDTYLKEKLKVDAKGLEDMLNKGDFCKLIEGYDGKIPHNDYTEMFISQITGKYKRLSIDVGEEENIDVLVRANKVENNEMSEFIVWMHVVRDRSSVRIDSFSV